MKKLICLITIILSLIIMSGCGKQVKSPIQNVNNINSGYCQYDGQEAACNKLMVSLQEEFKQNLELKEKVEKLLDEYNARIIYEYTVFVGWAIEVTPESKMFELKKRLEQLDGVSVSFSFIGYWSQ